MARSIGRTKSSKVTIAETGLPGRPKTGLPPSEPKVIRLAGTHIHLPEVQLRARVDQRLAHQVQLADGDAGGRHEHVGLRAPRDALGDGVESVGDDAQVEREAAGLHDLGHQ